MTVVTNLSDLSLAMRSALVDRARVKANTAQALKRRNLAVVTGNPWLGGYPITLTQAGERARDEVLCPLTPGTQVRNTLTGMVGTVVRVERGSTMDVVVLRWDGSSHETCGSPAYLELVSEPAPEHSCPNPWHRSAPARRQETCPECVDESLLPAHEHDEHCGSHPRAYGYLASAVTAFLAGEQPAAQLRADLASSARCLLAAGYGRHDGGQLRRWAGQPDETCGRP